MDFLLCQALRLTFGQRTWTLAELSSFIAAHFDYFNEGISLPSFIDNHDMNRFMVTTENDVRLLKLALLVLYGLPGPPIIYYGTEIPLSQNRSIHAKDAQGFDEARLPMQWARVDESSLIEYLSKLGDVRQKWPVLWQTGWVVQELDEQKDFIILGKKESCDHYMLINRSEKEVSVSINTYGRKNYFDLIGERLLSCEDGGLTLSLKPISGLLISAEMDQ